jgi:hypothetical protein
MADGALPLEATLADSVPAMPAVQRTPRREVQYYAALDLGTNNCRLLFARPSSHGIRVVEAFSRIVRLGEGVSASGRLGEQAIRRTLGALEICRDKMDLRGVTRARVFDIAAELQLPVEHRPFTLAEAQSAREAFFTAASAFVTPVIAIDGVEIANGRPGPTALRLRDLYLERARSEAV